jgi:hypothetical protein
VQISFIFVWLQFHFIRHALGQRIWAAPSRAEPTQAFAPRAEIQERAPLPGQAA